MGTLRALILIVITHRQLVEYLATFREWVYK